MVKNRMDGERCVCCVCCECCECCVCCECVVWSDVEQQQQRRLIASLQEQHYKPTMSILHDIKSCQVRHHHIINLGNSYNNSYMRPFEAQSNFNIQSSYHHLTWHQTWPKGHTGMAYETAVKGTQKTRKSRSANARWMMSRLVVCLICRFRRTEMMTIRLPTRPTIAMKPNREGTVMPTQYSRTEEEFAAVVFAGDDDDDDGGDDDDDDDDDDDESLESCLWLLLRFCFCFSCSFTEIWFCK